MNVKIQQLTRLLGRDITIEGVGGSSIPYEGYIELPFEVKEMEVTVPFLVTKQNIQDPIIGYNIIALLSAGEEKGAKVETIKAMLGEDVDEKTIAGLIDVLESGDDDSISSVRVPKEGLRLKSGETTNLRCKVEPLNLERKIPVLFEPEVEDVMPFGVTVQTSIINLKKGINTTVSVSVTNTNINEVWLPGRLSIGNLQMVKSVTPADVTRADDTKSRSTLQSGSTNDRSLSTDTEVRRLLMIVLSQLIRKLDKVGLLMIVLSQLIRKLDKVVLLMIVLSQLILKLDKVGLLMIVLAQLILKDV